MATYQIDGVTYETRSPRKVGVAIVWDVARIGRIVGKVVLRDGQMYYRDTAVCGEPLYLPGRPLCRLAAMLRMAHALTA